MTITINPVNFNVSKDLIERIEAIFGEVDKYNDQLVGLDIYLKSLTETDTGEKMVEVKIFLPGKNLFVAEKADDFVSAAQQAFDVVKRVVRKEKDKVKDRHEPRPDKNA
jgi:putative sigma-54 modulation protein